MYKLAHLGIAVTDCERSADFYRQALGCSVIDRLLGDTLKIIYLQSDDFIIELLEYSAPSPVTRSVGVYDHLAFTVPDLQAAIVSLQERGVKFESDKPRLTMNGTKIIFFSGPDGERIELMEA